MTSVQEIVNYYYELTDMADMGAEWYKEHNIVYSRYCRPAKDLLELCDGDIEKAKNMMERVKDWVDGFGGEFAIETVFKKWMELEQNKI